MTAASDGEKNRIDRRSALKKFGAGAAAAALAQPVITRSFDAPAWGAGTALGDQAAYDGQTHSVQVPGGRQVRFVISGAGGGAPSHGGVGGGTGTQLTGVIDPKAGSWTLYWQVGQGGRGGDRINGGAGGASPYGTGGAGGARGGKKAGDGGGGGGASALSDASSFPNSGAVLVAAAGGGGGASRGYSKLNYETGGNGGGGITGSIWDARAGKDGGLGYRRPSQYDAQSPYSSRGKGGQPTGPGAGGTCENSGPGWPASGADGSGHNGGDASDGVHLSGNNQHNGGGGGGAGGGYWGGGGGQGGMGIKKNYNGYDGSGGGSGSSAVFSTGNSTTAAHGAAGGESVSGAGGTDGTDGWITLTLV